MSNPNFDQVATTTLQAYRPRYADAITDKSAVMKLLKERGGVEEQSGGRTLVEPIIYAENTTAGWFSDYDILPTDPQTGISASEYPWAQLVASIIISGKQEFLNSENKTRVLSLLKGKTMQAQMTMTNIFNRDSHKDGTEYGGKQITGFSASVEEGSAYSVYGGIDSALQLYWRNQWIGFDAYASARLTNTSFLQNIDLDFRVFREVLTTLYNSTARNNDKPKINLCGQRVHEYFESSIVVNERYLKQGNVSDSKLANAGFEVLMFKNTPVVLDNNTPNTSVALTATNQEWVMLNTDFVKLIIGSGKNFTVSEFMRPTNQEARVSQIILYTQYTMMNRALQGRMTDIDFN